MPTVESAATKATIATITTLIVRPWCIWAMVITWVVIAWAPIWSCTIIVPISHWSSIPITVIPVSVAEAAPVNNYGLNGYVIQIASGH
jgi:hypothetical protein